MTMTELLALAERVEQADGTDRELDRAILASIGTHVLERRGRDLKAWWYPVNESQYGRMLRDCLYSSDIPRYTTSIDAALTLVPDGHFWSITMRGENRGGFHACCAKDGPLDWRDGAHPALAMTAAALRAIAGGADD